MASRFTPPPVNTNTPQDVFNGTALGQFLAWLQQHSAAPPQQGVMPPALSLFTPFGPQAQPQVVPPSPAPVVPAPVARPAPAPVAAPAVGGPNPFAGVLDYIARNNVFTGDAMQNKPERKLTPGEQGRALATPAAPQGRNEPNVVHGARSLLETAGGWLANPFGEGFGNWLKPGSPTLDQAFSTPAKREAQAARANAQPASVTSRVEDRTGRTPFAESYKDSSWDVAEAAASKATGVPVQYLRAVRLAGEKSNNSAVSPKDAKLVYQFIPATVQGIKKNYGVDVFESPQSAAMGAALLLKEGAQRNGGDFGIALREYHGGLDRNRWGPENRKYAARTDQYLGSTGNEALMVPGLVNPFDPSYGNMAMGQVDKAEAAMNTPFSAKIDRPAPPELPEPTPFAKTDFSKADAALAMLEPVAMTEKEKLKRQRQGWFEGLGRALMSLPDGAGLGKVLAAAGGGTLVGRAGAQREIDDRMDAFETKMAQYHAAVFRNESDKAQTIAREANQDIVQLNNYARDKWVFAKQQWDKDHTVSFGENGVTFTKAGPDGNSLIVQTIPNKPANAAAAALQKANIMSQMGGQANSANSQVATANNSYATALAASNAAETGVGDATAVVAAPLIAARHAVDSGRTREVIGNDAFHDQLDQDVERRVTALLGPKPDPTVPVFNNGSQVTMEKWMEKKRELWAGVIGEIALKTKPGQKADDDFATRLFQSAAGAMAVDSARRYEERRERTSVDAKGRTTRSVTTGGE